MDETVTVDATTGKAVREPTTAGQKEHKQRLVTEAKHIEQERDTERINREAVLVKVATAVGVSVGDLKLAFRLAGPDGPPITPPRP